MLVITQHIAKHELKPLRKYFQLEDILEGGRRILKGLATEIRPPGSLASFRFFKVRIGGQTKGRMIVFMMSGNKKIVPVLIRLKKDKIFGMNMSPNNPEVTLQISKNLDHILSDISQRHFEEFEL